MVLITLFAIVTILTVSNITAEARESKPIKVTYKDLSPKTKKQVECLAQNIYYEAGCGTTKRQDCQWLMVTMNQS
jgi:spore germination cell wall hydrolase CwlJ-like protein